MIEVKGLVKTYGPKRAVNGVSFRVNRGDILGFLGPNGAGKSTTMKMITGFLRPDSGTATVDGIDVTVDPVAVKGKLGYLPRLPLRHRQARPSRPRHRPHPPLSGPQADH